MIGIIDYNSGNIRSVSNALERLGQKFLIVNSSAQFEVCDKLIFPGVGAAGFAMENLKKLRLVKPVKSWDKPFLGICLGMQLLAEFSQEDDVDCLGIVPDSKVLKFDGNLKVPQIGWNKVNFMKNSQLFDGLESGAYFYFVNSYYLDCQADFVLSKTDYGTNFVSTIQKANFYGVQFHPEKSGESGLKLLANFCEKC